MSTRDAGETRTEKVKLVGTNFPGELPDSKILLRRLGIPVRRALSDLDFSRKRRARSFFTGKPAATISLSQERKTHVGVRLQPRNLPW